MTKVVVYEQNNLKMRRKTNFEQMFLIDSTLYKRLNSVTSTSTPLHTPATETSVHISETPPPPPPQPVTDQNMCYIDVCCTNNSISCLE